MTDLITPLVAEALTSTVLMEHAKFGQVSFCVTDGRYYTFVMDRAALQRLAHQIERALKQAPVSRRPRNTTVR